MPIWPNLWIRHFCIRPWRNLSGAGNFLWDGRTGSEGFRKIMTVKQIVAAGLLVLGAGWWLTGCGTAPAKQPAAVVQTAAPVEKPIPTLAEEVARYKGRKPKQWGEQ